jgi:hypothetical protein
MQLSGSEAAQPLRIDIADRLFQSRGLQPTADGWDDDPNHQH